VDAHQSLELLDEQIAVANAGEPADFARWRHETEVALRLVLGDTNQLYKNFMGIKYRLGVYTSSTPPDAHARARKAGVLNAIAVLRTPDIVTAGCVGFVP
jgi:hypothetical protein